MGKELIVTGTTKPRWEWINEKTTVGKINEQGVGYPGWISRIEGQETQVVARPELALFGLSMTGTGEVLGAAHVYG